MNIAIHAGHAVVGSRGAVKYMDKEISIAKKAINEEMTGWEVEITKVRPVEELG